MSDRPLSDPEETQPVDSPPTLPLDAAEADALEQSLEVPVDDDDERGDR
jgi:hypothetical protein